MPRRYRKRKNVRRKKSQPKKSYVPRSLSLGPYMPQSMIVKHKYAQIYALSQDYTTSDIGTNNMRNFRINSMYDPDMLTGVSTGSQPRLFDEMSNFYNTYRVIGAIARVKFINLSNEPCYVYTHLGNQQFSSSTNWNAQSLRELKHTKRRILHALSSGPKSVCTITTGYSPEKVEGKSKASIRGNPEFEALHTNNPAEAHLLSTCCTQVSNTLGGQENLNVQCEITIDFTAIWNDRKLLTTGS